METTILLARNLKIISGGQTGADRAALDWAMAHQVDHGGWCPKGRKAEDGILNVRYDLTETPSSEYSQRTEWNVRDSDGTVIFSISPTIFAGTLLTVELAKKYEKPYIHICKKLTDINSVSQFQLFISNFGIVNLNVAGPRASNEPEVYQFVREVLDRAFLP
ncbi:putative molybdenum carrier protein [Nostocaceae cyanobacterium CENA357]|uniref:Putative molybdenum carrier protein n=1 Tax=Atlanticothrix silvestris CENA357 TaxID=1725252 RepID=A0A8J7HCW7_9CYAN|nr:putative molybdenum carrier protein [Atlanticothrix silvestris]MBH8550950.1 putative molybdenum carrier protein [Atlanticothrix silvestris CENA357]